MEYGAVAIWLALSLVLGFAGLPLATMLCPRFADRGASLALPLVFMVVFLVSHVAGRISMAASLVVALVVLVALLVLAGRTDTDVDGRAAGEMALVFTVAFLFLVGVRAVDPAIIPAGGEKFLDFGLLKAILRADTIPPEDFWFAGEPVMYYYGGHLVAAQLTRLAGVTPAVAYNLALATFFGAYVTAAYGLAGNIAARAGQFERRAALLAAFFVGLAGNLFTPIRLLLRPLPADLAESIATTVGVWHGRFREGGLVTGSEPFSRWEATGVIDGTINEMPIFAFLNGDLHAHMMAPPFTLLLLGVLLAFTQTPGDNRRRRLALLIGVVPLLGATLAVVNTWSFPAVAGLTFLAVLFDPDAPRSLLPPTLRGHVVNRPPVGEALGRAAVALGSAVAVALLAVLWSLPFWLANAGGRTIAFLPERSSLADLLVVHGIFLLPIVLYLVGLAWVRFGLSRRQLAALALGVLGWIGGFALVDLAVVGLLGPILVGGYLLASRALSHRRTSRDMADGQTLPGFEIVPILGAAGLVLIVEFVYLAGEAGPGRFNTVFKVYAQVWAFFAVGTAIALVRLHQMTAISPTVPQRSTILRGFVAILVLVAAVYPALTLGVHVENHLESDEPATLDGLRYVERFHADEVPAIRWLDARAGTPTVLTAPGRAYDWSSAPSSLTGVPTVIGWQHHQVGFGRSEAAVERRASDVDALYTGNESTQQRLLAAYDIQFVYVGPSERQAYDRLTISTHPSLSVAADFEHVTIYRVEESGGSSGSDREITRPPRRR